jgi:hypothetical protein
MVIFNSYVKLPVVNPFIHVPTVVRNAIFSPRGFFDAGIFNFDAAAKADVGFRNGCPGVNQNN